jgi:hypothetical protein
MRENPRFFKEFSNYRFSTPPFFRNFRASQLPVFDAMLLRLSRQRNHGACGHF